MDLGNRILDLRTKRGWNQKELARRAGMRASRLSTIESGAKRPNLDEFARLADALDTTLDELRSDERRVPKPEAVDLVRELAAFATAEELAGLGRLLQVLLLGYRASLSSKPAGEGGRGL